MAVVLSNPDKRGKTERVREDFISIQGTIEALERAIVQNNSSLGHFGHPQRRKSRAGRAKCGVNKAPEGRASLNKD
jgi:hypothetical protein